MFPRAFRSLLAGLLCTVLHAGGAGATGPASIAGRSGGASMAGGACRKGSIQHLDRAVKSRLGDIR